MSSEAPFTQIPNPYIVGNPIKSADMFYGRQDEFEFARRKIESGDKNYVIVFCGERRSGKTSILFQILSGRLGDLFLPVLIDMQTMAGLKSDDDFFHEISLEICRALKHDAIRFRDYRFDASANGPYKAFQNLLDKVFLAHSGKHLILMIDEYELIEQKFDDGSLSVDVIPFFSGLLERSQRLSFVFTGSMQLEKRSRIEYWRMLFGKSLYRRISFFSEKETLRLILEPTKGSLDFPPEQAKAIYALTAGQPFYTQVFCQNLIDHLNEHQKATVEAEDVEAVTRGVIENPLPQMLYVWDSLSSNERLALSVLAEFQTQNAAKFWTASDVIKFLKKKDVVLNLPHKDLAAALEFLYERELVRKSGEKYRLQIELLGHWVRQEHSFWKTLQELQTDEPKYAQERPKRKFLYAAFAAVVISALGFFYWFQQQKAPDLAQLGEPAPETTDQALSDSSIIIQPSDSLRLAEMENNRSTTEERQPQATDSPEPLELRPFSEQPKKTVVELKQLIVTSNVIEATVKLFTEDSILLDQKLTGSPFFDLDPERKYHYLVEKAGYHTPAKKDLRFGSGPVTTIHEELREIRPARVHFKIIPTAEQIIIDGSVVSRNKDSFETKLEPGSHRIQIKNTKHGDFEVSIHVQSEENSHYLIDLLSKPASIQKSGENQ